MRENPYRFNWRWNEVIFVWRKLVSIICATKSFGLCTTKLRPWGCLEIRTNEWIEIMASLWLISFSQRAAMQRERSKKNTPWKNMRQAIFFCIRQNGMHFGGEWYPSWSSLAFSAFHVDIRRKDNLSTIMIVVKNLVSAGADGDVRHLFFFWPKMD